MQLAEAAASNIFTNTREGSIAIDATGVIIACNKQAEKLLSPLPLIQGKNILLEPSLFYTVENNKAVRTEKTPWIVTLNSGLAQEDVILGIQQEDGTNRWLSFSSQKSHTPADTYVSISFFDISKIVEQNILLTAKERQLNLLVSSLNDIVFEITQDGYIINYWTNNDKLLFYPPSVFLGKNLRDLLPDSVTTRSLQLISKTLKTGTEQEMDFLSPFESHKDCWYHLYIRSIAKSPDRVAVIISDITEEVENREKIKLNENKFNQAFHFSGVGMSLTGLDGYCLDTNKTLCQTLGYTKNELQSLRFFDITHPDDIAHDLELRKRLLDGEIDSFTIEKRYKHKSGHNVWCDTTVSLVRNHKNYPKFYIAQVQNISQAKQNIEILESQKAELESIKIDLETKVRQLEEFNQIVAHNLKGPVCNIQMLMAEIDTETDAYKRKAYLPLLQSSVTNLSKTLEELTSILELRHDNSPSFERCGFQAALNKIYLKQILDIERKGAILTTDFNIECIQFPKIYLERILDNLLSNALKYTVQDRQPKISISSYRQEGKNFLKVCDNGIGIDLPKYKSQLFMFKKIFHRGFESKGIDLFTIRYLVENLGGKIDVESEPGEGSAFIIQF